MQANGLSRTLSAEFLCLDRFKLLCLVLNTVVEDLEAVVLDLQHGQIWSCKVHKLPQQKGDFPAKSTNYHSTKSAFSGKGVLQVPFLLFMKLMGPHGTN